MIDWFQGLIHSFTEQLRNEMVFFFQAAKLAKAQVPPSEMFKLETDKYSAFDEQVSITVL